VDAATGQVDAATSSAPNPNAARRRSKLLGGGGKPGGGRGSGFAAVKPNEAPECHSKLV
jgi:hypothetical protein